MSGKRASLFSPWIWVTYGILFLVAIPWYWPADDRRVLLGFPLWVVATVGGSFLLSCFTAWLLLFRWPESTEEEEP